MNKLIFLLITLFSILTTSTHAQWWVAGGNVIWPHGNVLIKNKLFIGDTSGWDDLPSIYSYSDTSDFKNASMGLRQFIVPSKKNFWEPSVVAWFNLRPSGTDSLDITSNLISIQPDIIWSNTTPVTSDPFSSFVTNSRALFIVDDMPDTMTTYLPDLRMYSAEIWNTTSNTMKINNFSVFDFQPDYWTMGDNWDITTAKIFHSNLSARPNYWNNSTIVYHFYGSGDYPSYFGGDLEVDGNEIKFENLPSDSTGLSTGQIYFDNNGFLKRKF